MTSPLFLLLTIVLSGAVSVCAQPNRSVYTSLAEKQCRAAKTPEEGDYEGRCRGVGGYELLLTEGDLRQNITVIALDGKKHSLEFWNVVSSGFSTVGRQAEWRVMKGNKPVALIVRYNTSEDPAHYTRTRSYLVVAKITPTEICVTDKIKPSANANAEARRAADAAGTKPCLKTP